VRLDRIYPDSIDFPLIRLFDFDSKQAAQLHLAVLDLASERVNRLPIHELPGIVSIDDCELWFCIRSWDQGIVQVNPSNFTCGYIRRGKIASFCPCYNWPHAHRIHRH
jgi:hypothetical protein